MITTFLNSNRGTPNEPHWRTYVRQRSRLAFSLLETVVATLLVSITLVASLNSAAYVLKTTYQQAHASRATTIAQVLLAEIAAQPFEDTVNASGSLGKEVDETSAPRTAWDDCDDYHGWNTSSITDRLGVPLSAAAGWTASVTVGYATINDPAIDSATATNLKKINLSLTSPAGKSFGFVSLRCDKGTLLEPQSTTSNVLCHVNVAAQAAGDSVSIGTRVHNQQRGN